MKIITTGGAGFIGSNFVHHMVNRYPDYEIVNLDLLTYAGNLENLRPVEDKPNYELVKDDITGRKFIFELFEKEKPDMVVNFAAKNYMDRPITDPEVFMRTNVMGTTTLLDACRTHGIKRYYQVFIDEVHDDLPLNRSDLSFTEETPLHIPSPYSSSRASTDPFVLACHRTYSLPAIASRCSNNYGPYHSPEKLIPLIINRVLAGKELPVHGMRENMRDWFHAADHCQATDLVIYKGREGEVYNIGGYNEYTNLEVVKTILEASDKPESLVKLVTGRSGHDIHYAINPAKMKTELGQKPMYNPGTGIEQTIRRYPDNQDWWRSTLSGEYSNYFDKMYGSRLQANVWLTEEGSAPEHVCEACLLRRFPFLADHYWERG